MKVWLIPIFSVPDILFSRNCEENKSPLHPLNDLILFNGDNFLGLNLFKKVCEIIWIKYLNNPLTQEYSWSIEWIKTKLLLPNPIGIYVLVREDILTRNNKGPALIWVRYLATKLILKLMYRASAGIVTQGNQTMTFICSNVRQL